MVSTVDPVFFSRLVLCRKGSRLLPSDPYTLHQLLWRGFDSGPRPFLFRADRARAEGVSVLKVLVQASTEAQWSRLGEMVDSAEQVQRSISIVSGAMYRFYLRANPTKRLGASAIAEKQGNRVGLMKEDEQRAWVERKGQQGGFAIVGVQFVRKRPWRWRRDETHARHDGVDIEGHLRVTDAGAFSATVRNGLGAAKAFGFGLLSLAPP